MTQSEIFDKEFNDIIMDYVKGKINAVECIIKTISLNGEITRYLRSQEIDNLFRD